MGKQTSRPQIPDWIVERVAFVIHRRSCNTFDGGTNRVTAASAFVGEHRSQDQTYALIYLNDVCTALCITDLGEALGLRREDFAGDLVGRALAALVSAQSDALEISGDPRIEEGRDD